MSSTLPNKMYHYEVTPPEKVWEHIAAALDEWKADQPLAAALLRSEITPPSHHWQQIDEALNEWVADQQMAASLNSSEAEPPAGIWDSLSQELDAMAEDEVFRKGLSKLEITPPDIWARLNTQLSEEEPEQQLAGKLLALEIWPPEDNWNKIEASLEEKPAAKIIRVSPWKKWMAAAAIVGVLAVSSILLLQRNQGSDSGTAKTQTPTVPGNQNTSVPPELSVPGSNKILDTNEATASTSKEVRSTVKQTNRKEPVVVASLVPDLSDHSTDLNPVEIKRRVHKAVTTANTEDATAALDSRYYLLLNADGELVKVSKKLNDMQCVIKSGLDIPLDENDEKNRQCNEQVKEWQDKLNSSPVVSTLGIAALIAEK